MPEGAEHKKLKKKIMEIGKFEGYRVEKELPLVDEFIVDVAWFKKPGRNPKYVFEVVVGSNVTNPLTSLKTAIDEWNCQRAILVTHGEKLKKARHLLDTSFSEIASQCNLIDSSKIHRLRELTGEYNKIKSAIGYRTFPT